MNIEDSIYRFFNILADTYSKNSIDNHSANNSVLTEKDQFALAALNFISEVVELSNINKSIVENEKMNMLNNYFELIDKDFSRKINYKVDSNYNSFFNFISKKTNENFLSDNLGAILSPKKTALFSDSFINNLMKRKSQWKQDRILNVCREHSLSNFGIVDESARMRIDLYVECEKSVIILENKTFTSEHDSQTIRYFNAVSEYSSKDVFGIFLTPYGAIAEHSDYLNISYPDLIFSLNESLDSFTNFKNREFVELITKELANTFILSTILCFDKARTYRRSHE